MRALGLRQGQLAAPLHRLKSVLATTVAAGDGALHHARRDDKKAGLGLAGSILLLAALRQPIGQR